MIALKVWKEYRRARSLNEWPEDIIYQVSFISEEAGEAVKAANDFRLSGASKAKVREEVIHCLVTCIRYLRHNRKE